MAALACRPRQAGLPAPQSIYAKKALAMLPIRRYSHNISAFHKAAFNCLPKKARGLNTIAPG